MAKNFLKLVNNFKSQMQKAQITQKKKTKKEADYIKLLKNKDEILKAVWKIKETLYRNEKRYQIYCSKLCKHKYNNYYY